MIEKSCPKKWDSFFIFEETQYYRNKNIIQTLDYITKK